MRKTISSAMGLVATKNINAQGMSQGAITDSAIINSQIGPTALVCLQMEYAHTNEYINNCAFGGTCLWRVNEDGQEFPGHGCGLGA